jgi:hypothetical protein
MLFRGREIGRVKDFVSRGVEGTLNAEPRVYANPCCAKGFRLRPAFRDYGGQAKTRTSQRKSPRGYRARWQIRIHAACANPEYEVNSPEGIDSHETTTFGQDGV